MTSVRQAGPAGERGTDTPPPRSRGTGKACARSACLALLLYGMVAVSLLVTNDYNPAIFIHFGLAAPNLELARHDFGVRVPVPLKDGQDGEYFWVLGRDPGLVHTQTVIANLDRPAYRAERIGYPAMASPWGILGPYGLAWGLLVTNLVAVVLGALVTTAVALRLGASSVASLCWTANPLVLLSVVLDTSDALALAALLVALWAVLGRRWWVAGMAGCIAGLTKEPSLLPLIAVAVLAVGIPRRVRILLIIGPLVALGGWAVYERWRLGWPPSQIQEFSYPLGGYLEAFRRGWLPFGDWGNAAVALALLSFSAWVLWNWAQNKHDVLWSAALPIAVLVPILSGQVLDLSTNSLRVVGPAVTCAGLAYFVRRARRPGAPHDQKDPARPRR